MKNHLSGRSYLYLLLIAIPIIFYFIIVSCVTLNFPLQDDYEAILGFSFAYENAVSAWEKIALILNQHNEHRIVFGKLITIVYYKIFGQINFIHLTIIGNLSLIGIWIMLFKSVKVESTEKRLLLFIPVTLFLFNFRYFEVSCWAMASLQNIWVLLFAFLSLFFLFNDKKQSVTLAIVFATIATFTSGNGILTFVTGLIMLFLRKDSRKVISLFTAAFLMNIVGFVLGSHKVEKHPSLINSFLLHPFDLFLYPLNFIGSLFAFETDWIRYLIGALVLLIVVYIFIKKIYKINYYLVSLLLFMILTVGIVSISRFGFGVDQARASRYMINSTLIYILIGLIFYELCTHHFLSKTFSKNFILFAFILSIIFNANSYKHDWYRVEVQTSRKENIELINQGANMKYDFMHSAPKAHPIKILSESNTIGLFRTNPNGYGIEHTLTQDAYKIDSTNSFYHIDTFEKSSDSIYDVKGWYLMKNIPSNKSIVSIGLEDSLSNLYVETTQKIHRGDVADSFGQDNCNYNLSGFSKEINIRSYPKGSYKISLLITTDRLRIKIPLNKTIAK